METQSFTETVDQLRKAFKSTLDIYSKTSLSLLEAYGKQLDTAYGFYNDFIEKSIKGEVLKNYKTSQDFLKKNLTEYNEAVEKTMGFSKEIVQKIFDTVKSQGAYSPVTSEMSESILGIFNRQADLSRDFGARLLSILNKEFVLSNNDFDKFSTRFQELLRETTGNSDEIIKKFLDTYNKEAGYTKEATEKLLNNINRQFDVLADTNANFLNELIKSFQSEKTAENGKTSQSEFKQA